MSLKIDMNRREIGNTSIFVRAKMPGGEWESCDIAELEKESLLEWLRSRGGDNKWAEDVVGILRGHGHLHEVCEVNDGN